jgi:microcystin-dependent protein
MLRNWAHADLQLGLRLLQGKELLMDTYVGEIRLFMGAYTPVGWQACDGSLLPISEYETLYSLIGTLYGGDGRSTFAVPDLRGRVPLAQGSGVGLTPRPLASKGGSENVSVLTPQMPAHNHAFNATSAAATTSSPVNALPATVAAPELFYMDPTGLAPNFVKDNPLPSDTVGFSGGSGPHPNVMPSVVGTYIIALNGIYPQQQ